MMADLSPGIGHNQAPLGELLAESYKALIAEVAEVVAEAAAIALVTDDSVDQQATSIGLDLGTLRKSILARQDEEKRPHLDANAAIGAFFKRPLESIDAELARLLQKISDHKRRLADAERARQLAIADEARREAQRIAAQADEARKAGEVTIVQEVIAGGMERRAKDAEAAAAAPMPMATTNKATGAKSSAKVVWKFAIENPSLIPLDQLRGHFTAAALDAAVRSFVASGGHVLPGVRIYEDTNVKLRRGK